MRDEIWKKRSEDDTQPVTVKSIMSEVRMRWWREEREGEREGKKWGRTRTTCEKEEHEKFPRWSEQNIVIVIRSWDSHLDHVFFSWKKIYFPWYLFLLLIPWYLYIWMELTTRTSTNLFICYDGPFLVLSIFLVAIIRPLFPLYSREKVHKKVLFAMKFFSSFPLSSPSSILQTISLKFCVCEKFHLFDENEDRSFMTESFLLQFEA